MHKLAVVLLSGGLDSTTVAALARVGGFDLLALTVHYGQAHAREIESAKRVAKALEIVQRTVDVPFFRDLAWYSALTTPDRFAAPNDRSAEAMAEMIPITYVPLRNTFFLTLGAAYLESAALHAIEVEHTDPSEINAALFIAANAIDYSGYPDCRPEYYRAAGEAFRLGSKLGSAYGVNIRIETPIIDKKKAEIIELARVLGAPLHLTWSCYHSGPKPCGRCDSCVLRARGFEEAGVPDPGLVGLEAPATA